MVRSEVVSYASHDAGTLILPIPTSQLGIAIHSSPDIYAQSLSTPEVYEIRFRRIAAKQSDPLVYYRIYPFFEIKVDLVVGISNV